jgi:hypothetical protein
MEEDRPMRTRQLLEHHGMILPIARMLDSYHYNIECFKRDLRLQLAIFALRSSGLEVRVAP